jgi:hypothetical protein
VLQHYISTNADKLGVIFTSATNVANLKCFMGVAFGKLRSFVHGIFYFCGMKHKR